MMYREDIMNHYERPRNEGRLEDGLEEEGRNPSCGDHLKVYLKVQDGVLEEISHETDACAIATASVSIASEKLENMQVEDIMSLDRDWMIEQLGSDISPMRIKCAMLGLETVQSALEDLSP